MVGFACVPLITLGSEFTMYGIAYLSHKLNILFAYVEEMDLYSNISCRQMLGNQFWFDLSSFSIVQDSSENCLLLVKLSGKQFSR